MIEKETKASQTLYKRFTQASRNTNKRHPEKVLGDKKIFVASHNLDWATINSLLHFVHETKQYKIKDDNMILCPNHLGYNIEVSREFY